jgi:hypothetical protein
VHIDAVRALSREGHGDGDQFLVFNGNGSICDGRFVESPESLHYLGRKGIHFLQLGQILFVIHKLGYFRLMLRKRIKMVVIAVPVEWP